MSSNNKSYFSEFSLVRLFLDRCRKAAGIKKERIRAPKRMRGKEDPMVSFGGKNPRTTAAPVDAVPKIAAIQIPQFFPGTR